MGQDLSYQQEKQPLVQSQSKQVLQAQVVTTPQAGTMQVNVPIGLGPGSVFQVSTPNGQPMQVTVPPGIPPGGSFTVQCRPAAAAAQVVQPQVTQVDTTGDGVADSIGMDTTGDGVIDTIVPLKASTMQVTVPAGVGPGSALQVQSPSGRPFQVTVPAGVPA